jgi:hypothetical protein
MGQVSFPISENGISGYEVTFSEEENMNSFEKPSLLKYEPYRITELTDIPEPIPIITINGEIISTVGNLTTISGASKSGKSAFSAPIIAEAIINEGEINDRFEGMAIARNKNNLAVIHIDTEQARHKQQKNLLGILRRANLNRCPDHLLSYNIRQLNIEIYKQVTEEICEAASTKFGGIHLILIDGIADYIKNVNDESESNSIVKFFEELAIKYDAPIIIIVHTNPGGDKERGHLGSQCQRKSESVLSIKMEGEISYLEAKFLRMAGKADIPKLQFRYDKEKGYHIGCGIRSMDSNNKADKKEATLKMLCEKVFAIPKAHSYGEAINLIMEVTEKSRPTAKGIFSEMKESEMIIQATDKRWRLNTNDSDEIGDIGNEPL